MSVDQSQFIAYDNFLKTPSSKTAFYFVISCHKYISVLASKWRQNNFSRREKIYEIISEMYLILLEDFTAGKSISCQSAFSYLDSKLKSLIYPAKNHFLTDITKVDLNSLTLSKQFSFEKVRMTEEIVKIIRQNVLEDSLNNNGLVIFLFIHIYPKIHWISEIMAKKGNTSVESRYEADAKRINRFNAKLRNDFEQLSSGNWHEILDWSHSERRHLAWKIIDISPTEVEANVADCLSTINNWRDTFNIHNPKNFDNLPIAEKVYKSMASIFPKYDKLKVAEEKDFWGKSPDIINQIIGDFYNKDDFLNESISDYTIFDYLSDNSETKIDDDSEFIEIAKELSNWFDKLLTERNKSLEKNLKWKY